MDKAAKTYGITLPDRQLACAPVESEEAQDYFAAMAAAANYAWTNRQMIVHWVRESFEQVFHADAEDMNMELSMMWLITLPKRKSTPSKEKTLNYTSTVKELPEHLDPVGRNYLQITGK
jgi:RNA-splicing ligase RtcB